MMSLIYYSFTFTKLDSNKFLVFLSGCRGFELFFCFAWFWGVFYPSAVVGEHGEDYCFFLVFCVFLIIFVGFLEIAALNRGYMRADIKSNLISLSFRVRLEILGLLVFFWQSSGRKSQQYKVPGLKFIIKAFPKFPFGVHLSGAFVKIKSNKQFKFLLSVSDILNIYSCNAVLLPCVMYIIQSSITAFGLTVVNIACTSSPVLLSPPQLRSLTNGILGALLICSVGCVHLAGFIGRNMVA